METVVIGVIAAITFLVGLLVGMVILAQAYRRWDITTFRLQRETGVFHLSHDGTNWMVEIGAKNFKSYKWGDENSWANLLRQEGEAIELLWMINSKGDSLIIGYNPTTHPSILSNALKNTHT